MKTREEYLAEAYSDPRMVRLQQVLKEARSWRLRASVAEEMETLREKIAEESMRRWDPETDDTDWYSHG